MQLLPQQIEGAKRLASGNDIPNYSEAGTGKTLTTLEAVRRTKIDRGLIIAPPIALPMWKAEIERFLGADVEILKTGKSPLKGKDFYVCSYNIAMSPQMLPRLMERDNGVLVNDEAHYLKSLTAKRTIAMFGHSMSGKGGLFETSSQYWPLTGTPIARYPDDLWSQLRAPFGDVLREHGVQNYEAFQRKFCIMKLKQYHPRQPAKWEAVSGQNESLLNKILYQEIGALRYTMDEVAAHMPPLTFRDIHFSIKRDPDLESAMADVDLQNLAQFDNPETNSAANVAWHILGRLKAKQVAEYASDERVHGPILIGYWHTDVGDIIMEALKGHDVGRVMGGTSSDRKEEIRVAFNSGNLDFIVGQMSAMNVSWNLQECGNRVVLAENLPSPFLLEQFVKRVWRFGQKQHVQVDIGMSDHPLDKVFSEIRARKAATASVVLAH